MLSRTKRMAGELIILGLITQGVYWFLFTLSRFSFNIRMIVIGIILILISFLVIRAKG
ncbi:MAG: hypothetical protein GOU98_00605 [Candidatus Altiarchaeota archaeon]|nr:hypothetical protein [Candidatus Altiarchaeota archaeon]